MYMTIKLGFVSTIFFLAVTEVINEVADTAKKVGTLGMQGLIAFLLMCLGLVIWYLEKRRSQERADRDKLIEAQYNNLLNHHENFAKEATIERSNFHLEMKAHAAELRGLTERSIVAMHAMATSTDALREHLQQTDRLLKQHQQQQLKQ